MRHADRFEMAMRQTNSRALLRPIVRRVHLYAITSLLATGANIALWGQPAPSAPPTLVPRLSRQELMNEEHADLKVTLNFPSKQENATVTVISDPGIQINPRTFSFQNISGAVIKHFDVVGDRNLLRPSDYVISVDLSVGSAQSANTVASETVMVKYSRRIDFWLYLLWGILGVIIGYVLRLLTKVLASVPAPSPAPEEHVANNNAGPITRFVTGHYHFVEFCVTCVLGFLALLALAKLGLAPDGAAYWYGALGLGVPLGLLTNTDLIMRIK